jgi:hypothetical protein
MDSETRRVIWESIWEFIVGILVGLAIYSKMV